jgi:hypothetical protein
MPFVSLRTGDGVHYVIADNGGGGTVSAWFPWAAAHETFELVPVANRPVRDGDAVALRTYGGWFLRSATDGALVATARTVDASSTFTAEVAGGGPLEDGATIGLRTGAGTYVTAVNGGGGAVVATAPARGSSESFTVQWRPSHFLWLRDRIVIDATFVATLDAERQAGRLLPGQPMLIAAREVVHAPGASLRLPGYRIRIVADRYDPAGQNLDVSGAAGGSGAAGTDGVAGDFAVPSRNKKGRPGGAGTAGGDGGNGADAPGITLICGTTAAAPTLLADGGHGGNGGRGGTGGAGGEGREEDGPLEERRGTNGGAGGTGGRGGNGGNGGYIVVVTGGTTGANTSVLAGSAGAAGPGGSGGVGGFNGGVDGADGATGAAGAPGVPGLVTRASATASEVQDYLRWELGPDAAVWANYRTRLADYHYRRYRDTDPTTAPQRIRALQECDAALAVAPATAVQARLLQQQIFNNQNVFGLPFDHDPIPDFRRFESQAADYGPFVNAMFTNLQQLLLAARATGVNRAQVLNTIQITYDRIPIFRAEQAAAVIEQGRAAAGVSYLDDEINKIDSRIRGLTQKMRDAEIAAADGRVIASFFTFASIMVSVITAVIGNGAALAALPGLWANFTAQTSGPKITREGNKLIYDNKTIFDWFEKKEVDGQVKTVLKPEVKELVANVQEIYNNTKQLIDQGAALAELNTVKVEAEPDEAKEIKQLLIARVQLAFERLDAALRGEQAQVLVQAANLRVAAAQAEIDRANSMVNLLTSDVASLGDISRLLLRVIHDYADIVVTNVFLAARSLAVLTFGRESAEPPYDLGYVHPDMEEDAFSALRRGDTSTVIDLLGKLLASWSQLTTVATLRNSFETYDAKLDKELQLWMIDDPLIVGAMRQSKSTTFTIPLDDLPRSRREAKVIGVWIALIGATAKVPQFSMILEHTGEAEVRLSDTAGTVVKLLQPPRRTPQQVTVGSAGQVLGGGSTDRFWGRSPTARWRLVLEPAVEQQAEVDLSGLTEIHLAFEFKSVPGPA